MANGDSAFELEDLPYQTRVEARRDGDQPANAFDFLPFGMIFVDIRGEVVEMNRAARRLIAAADGLRIDRRRLSAEQRNEAHALRRLIAMCTDEQTQRTASMTVTRTRAEGPLEIMVSGVTDRNVAFSRLAAAVVFLNEPARITPPDAAFLRDTLKLSPCEIRLVTHLVAGDTVEEAARDMNVTPNTARTHLKSIFLKTGVRRQADLVRRIANSLASLVLGDE